MGILEKLPCWARGGRTSFIHHSDTPAKSVSLVPAVRNEQDRAAVIFQQFPHLRLKPLPKVCIQRRKRLVQHQKLWLVHQYPAQRRPLLLAA